MRPYNLLRAYVNREWERIKDLDLVRAEEELDQPSIPTSPGRPADAPAPSELLPEVDQLVVARKILGIPEGCAYSELRKAYDRLNKRADPARFPEGSQEREHAAELQRRVNLAYTKLADQYSETERRFKSLEIE